MILVATNWIEMFPAMANSSSHVPSRHPEEPVRKPGDIDATCRVLPNPTGTTVIDDATNAILARKDPHQIDALIT